MSFSPDYNSEEGDCSSWTIMQRTNIVSRRSSGFWYEDISCKGLDDSALCDLELSDSGFLVWVYRLASTIGSFVRPREGTVFPGALSNSCIRNEEMGGQSDLVVYSLMRYLLVAMQIW